METKLFKAEHLIEDLAGEKEWWANGRLLLKEKI